MQKFVKFFRWYFGKIWDTKILFWNYLTFSTSTSYMKPTSVIHELAPRSQVQPDLERERQICPFSQEEITHLIDGGPDKTAERRFLQLPWGQQILLVIVNSITDFQIPINILLAYKLRLCCKSDSLCPKSQVTVILINKKQSK